MRLTKKPTGDVTGDADELRHRRGDGVAGDADVHAEQRATDQTVTVTGVNNATPGDRTANVTHAATGGGYSVTSASTVAVAVEDDDAGLTASQTTRTVDEAAGEAWYTLVLVVQPTDER